MIAGNQRDRFSREFKFDLPTAEERFKSFIKIMSEDKQMDTTVTFEEFLSFMLDEFSHRDIRHWVEKAKTHGPHWRTSKADHFRMKLGLYLGCNCRQDCPGRTTKTYHDIKSEEFLYSPLTSEDLKKVRDNVFPSASKDHLKKYDRYERGETNIKDVEDDRRPETQELSNTNPNSYGGHCFSCWSIVFCNKLFLSSLAILFLCFAGYFLYTKFIAKLFFKD